MTDDALAGRGVGGMGGHGTDNAVVGRGIWGAHGHAVQRAVLLGDGWLCISQCAHGVQYVALLLQHTSQF